MSFHRLPASPVALFTAVLLAINVMAWIGVATHGEAGSFALMAAAGSAIWVGYLALTTP